MTVVTPLLVLARALTDAGIPYVGLSIGNPADRATWRVDYSAAATPAQRTAGDLLIATFDTQDPTTLAEVKADMGTAGANTELLQAIAQALWECIPAPTMTKPQLKARIVAIFKTL